MSNEDKLDQILHKLEIIEQKLDQIGNSCQGMDEHIGFVEGVYGTLRSPLDYVARQVNRISGSPQEALPAKDQKQLKNDHND